MRRSGWLCAMAVIASGALPAVAAPGDRFNLQPADLPPPNTTSPTDLTPDFDEPPPGFVPQVPPGFVISLFAERLGFVRSLAVAPDGDVFVVRPDGDVFHLRDTSGAGKADRIEKFASGFRDPHGIAIRDGQLYISDRNAVWRAPYLDRASVPFAEFKRVTSAPDLRPDGIHPTRDIAFDGNGQLYLAFGSREDVAEEQPPDATIQRVATDGSLSVFATGLRNVEGLAFAPGTNDLWVTVNERDGLGARVPADFMAQARAGDFFGWPYAYNGPNPDPVFGVKRPDLVAKTKVPEVLFTAHSAPLGLVFYSGAQFPPDYRGNAFVAIHASGPYDRPDGYKVVRVRFQDGKAVGGYEDFVTGFFSTANGKVHMWGSPSQLAIAKDGSLLFVDDKNNCVWRVAYKGD